MAEFVFKNKYFEFNGQVNHQVQPLALNLHLHMLVFSWVR